MTEPIEANAKTDLDVAEAVGIEVHEDSRGKARRYPGGSRAPVFSPTDCWADAMEAAEAVGLFEDQHNNLSKRKNCWCFEDHTGFSICTYYGETPELALCEAILAMAEAKADEAELHRLGAKLQRSVVRVIQSEHASRELTRKKGGR